MPFRTNVGVVLWTFKIVGIIPRFLKSPISGLKPYDSEHVVLQKLPLLLHLTIQNKGIIMPLITLFNDLQMRFGDQGWKKLRCSENDEEKEKRLKSKAVLGKYVELWVL